MISLRAHHLVCLQSFQGKGYDDAFVSHASGLLDRLLDNAERKIITVANKCDDLCEFCPNNWNGKCEDEQKIAALDDCYAKLLEVSFGDVVSFLEARRKIAERISKEQFEQICGDCKWHDICRNNLEYIKCCKMR